MLPIDYQAAHYHTLSLLAQPLKISALLYAIRASKLKSSSSLRGHFSPGYTGVKRLRPTRRRFAKVALPLLLELRFRKPCCRLRRILDG